MSHLHQATQSTLHGSALDQALEQYAVEVDAIAAALKQRAAESADSKNAEGEREHPTAFIENLTAAISVPPGCLFVGHIKTDMDSVGGAVSAAELYNGVACLAEPVETLNGEIMYACNYALTGEKPRWGAEDVTKWRESHESSLDGFGNSEHPLAYFGDVFSPDSSKVVLVDHSAPTQMVPSLKEVLIDQARTDILKGIIDHHALDEQIYTKGPLFMDLRPWGSMCTIITHSFVRSAKPIPVDVARLMLCAIMSDTVNLTSPTTTMADRYIVPLLTRFCGEPDHNKLAQGLFRAKTAWFAALTPFQCVRADQKTFSWSEAGGANHKWGWATVQVTHPEMLLCNANRLLLELQALKDDKELAFAFLSVVDLSTKTSKVLLCGDAEVSLAQLAFPDGQLYNACDEDTSSDADSTRETLAALGINDSTSGMDVGARISRKKQFKPAVDAALSNGWCMPEAPGQESKQSSPRSALRTTSRIVDQRLTREFSLEQ